MEDPDETPRSDWTSGQYVVFRVLLGVSLCVEFIGELGTATLVALLGAAASICVAAGARDRVAAIVCGVLLTIVAVARPAGLPLGLVAAYSLLALHVVLPPVSRGDAWALSRRAHRLVWVALVSLCALDGLLRTLPVDWIASWGTSAALGSLGIDLLAARGASGGLAGDGLAADGLAGVAGGVLGVAECAFVALAPFRRIRPSAWTVLLAAHIAALVLVDASVGRGGILLLHLLAFDPAWAGGPQEGPPCTVFYDGGCGLCHGFVRFLLGEDRAGATRFAPLGGETFTRLLPQEEQAELPDSVVVVTPAGDILVRTAAVVSVLVRVGGAWRLFGKFLSVLPCWFTDAVYDFIARRRKLYFSPPADSCPIIPERLRARFLP